MPLTLGYVFWHRPSRGTLRAAYEASLVRFQRSLKAHPPEGFVESFCLREEALPWSRSRSVSYEDWYLVRGFEALGDLNEGAVDAANRGPHDEAARLSSVIAGGLYKMLGGDLRAGKVRVETWMKKPDGMGYQAFFEALSGSLGSRRTMVWQRQLVLGPAPEFCLHSERVLPLPRGVRGKVVRVRPLSEKTA